MIEIVSVEPRSKGKYRVTFDNGITCLMYRSEMHCYAIREGAQIAEADFKRLLTETLGKRAKKRAMHLLEQMDRTEKQLREKLLLNEYPEECVEAAISYVKQFHYLDDYRYACTYIRYHGEKMSRRMLEQKLLQKGVSRTLIAAALEEEYAGEEQTMILEILQKKHYDPEHCEDKEYRRIYQYLMRRGFRGSEIQKAMKCEKCTIYSGDY